MPQLVRREHGADQFLGLAVGLGPVGTCSEVSDLRARGRRSRVTLGALLEIFLMIGNVGTAVVMFPILRRYSETLVLS